MFNRSIFCFSYQIRVGDVSFEDNKANENRVQVFIQIKFTTF
jgi:hypothetical protein